MAARPQRQKTTAETWAAIGVILAIIGIWHLIKGNPDGGGFIGVGIVTFLVARALIKNRKFAPQRIILREPIPQRVKDAVWNRDGGKCVKCGSQVKLEFDHILPVIHGGKSTYRNLQLLCETHNRRKGARVG